MLHFCLLWCSGCNPTAYPQKFIFFCSPSGVNQESSPELVPLSILLLFWGSFFCFPLPSKEDNFFAGVPFFQPRNGGLASRGLVSPRRPRFFFFFFLGAPLARGGLEVINAQLLALGSIPLAATLMARGVGYLEPRRGSGAFLAAHATCSKNPGRGTRSPS